MPTEPLGLDVHSHSFRQFAATPQAGNNGSEQALLQLMGWSDRTIVDRYVKQTAADRALAAQAKFVLVSRL